MPLWVSPSAAVIMEYRLRLSILGSIPSRSEEGPVKQQPAKRRLGAAMVAAAACAASLGLVAPAQASAPDQGGGPDFRSCDIKAHPKLECAEIEVPLNYSNPDGKQIKIAISRVEATGSPEEYQGILLVNPGGPGGSGIGLAGFVASQLPDDVAAAYDVVGFDPRGVGRSEPAIHCVDAEKYYDPPRPDHVPDNWREEAELLQRAKKYARGCAQNYGWMLPHMTTANTARDMDRIRGALGAEQINYFGYSYGTYLGSVYATLFPDNVRRMVLDSIVNPKKVWYRLNLAQDYAFDQRINDFFGWVAKYDEVYHLGTSRKQVAAAWYSMRDKLETNPAAGTVGPSELDDIYTPAGYADSVWPDLAKVFASYVNEGSEQALADAYEQYAAMDASGENGYAVYLSVECRDAKWPRNWARWHNDAERIYREAPFMVWSNTWYNAPCAFWSAPGGKPVQVSGKDLPPVLLLQATEDAATPYPGAKVVHQKLKSSRLVVEVGGGNHGAALGGNKCIDSYLFRYLRDGTLPADRKGPQPDATCQRDPAPKPSQQSTGKSESPQGGQHVQGLLRKARPRV